MDKDSSYNARMAIQSELLYGEELLWCGAPERGTHVSGRGVYNTVFGLFFAIFAVFWTVTAMSMGGMFGLFGIPFIFAGIYVIFGNSFKKSSMIYGVTDKRIIIKSRRSTESIQFSSIRQLSRRDFSDGSADIYIDTGRVVHRNHGYASDPIIMFAVPNAASVYAMISERINMF